jgi:hypothetical protein
MMAVAISVGINASFTYIHPPQTAVATALTVCGVMGYISLTLSLWSAVKIPQQRMSRVCHTLFTGILLNMLVRIGHHAASHQYSPVYQLDPILIWIALQGATIGSILWLLYILQKALTSISSYSPRVYTAQRVAKNVARSIACLWIFLVLPIFFYIGLLAFMVLYPLLLAIYVLVQVVIYREIQEIETSVRSHSPYYQSGN